MSAPDAPGDRSPAASLQKTALRRSLLATRRALPQAVWRQQSDRLCAQLQSWSKFRQAGTILAYFSFRQEPDLSPLFHSGQRWGFSRCVGRSLHWHRWSPADPQPLQPGPYGILEPHPDAPALGPYEVDLLLVPAVACDRRGYRLGYGGGFYDRLLSSPDWATIPAIGIVFEFAHLPQLPIDSWDQPLRGVCTEVGLWLVD